jgi:parvulin-like peptidyl-prolyl isomerase
MKKLLAVLLLTALLVGCSSGPALQTEGTESTAPTTQDTEATTTAPTESDTTPPEDVPVSTEIPEIVMNGTAGYGNNDEKALSHYSLSTASPTDEHMTAPIAVGAQQDTVFENRHLQIAYWTEYLNFMNSYGSYATMLGMDPNKPLYTQQMDDGRTWEQYFLSFAVQGLKQNYALSRYAADNGIELSPEDQKTIEDITKTEGGFAEEYIAQGYADADSYLQYYFGDGMDAVAYQEYYDMYLRAANCYQAKQEEIRQRLAEDEILAYYAEHKETFENQGKIQANNINVRHILIQPEGEQSEWTEEDWTAAEASAQAIYDNWLAEPTEERFIALAIEHTMDPGSTENGGLYEDVAPGDMVTEFNDWCFDPERKVGDHGIVKTTYGFHIMYFAGTTETRAWYDAAAEQLVYEKLEAFLKDCQTLYPLSVDYTLIRIFDVATANTAQPAG